MSNEFYIKNLLLAREVMQEVPDGKVFLDSWQQNRNNRGIAQEPECGTIACFGGWIALSPKFPDVAVGAFGRPTMSMEQQGKTYTLGGSEIAHHLFGDGRLFDQAQWDEKQFISQSHKEIVLARIDTQLGLLGHE